MHPKFNCFSGKNGVGKTNLLDAVHVLSMSKSFFSLKDDELIKWGEDFYRIEGRFDLNDSKDEIVVKYPKGGKKEILKNESKYKRYADHIGFAPMVMIAPGDEMKWLSKSSERRKWMDTSLSQSSRDYLEAIMSYNRQLKQRNAYLKDGAPMKIRQDLLEVYNLRMAPALETVRAQRSNFIDTIRPLFNNYYKVISNGIEDVDIHYIPDIEGDPLSIWERSWSFDISARRTLKGVHKDDILITIEGQDARNYASQGQRKSLMLAARLSQYVFLNRELGKKPLLLLDDIFDKLDPDRVGALIDLIAGDDFGQVILTDTEPDRLEKVFREKEVDFYHYLVSKGTCERI